ncbi:MAG: hypothetical protein IIB28_02645 [Chloroflexi bacterium]|nr:hypothetical protein [Chloroflexota bacterium]
MASVAAASSSGSGTNTSRGGGGGGGSYPVNFRYTNLAAQNGNRNGNMNGMAIIGIADFGLSAASRR